MHIWQGEHWQCKKTDAPSQRSPANRPVRGPSSHDHRNETASRSARSPIPTGLVRAWLSVLLCPESTLLLKKLGWLSLPTTTIGPGSTRRKRSEFGVRVDPLSSAASTSDRPPFLGFGRSQSLTFWLGQIDRNRRRRRPCQRWRACITSISARMVGVLAGSSFVSDGMVCSTSALCRTVARCGTTI